MTGLVAQQQCVGPLHTPLSDVAVTSLSHFDTVGTATSIGEQPMKMLCDVTKGARMCVAEALTNIVFAPITSVVLNNNAGLPHTQGTQGIFKLKKISGNFDLFFILRKVLIFSKKIQESFKIF